MFIVLVGMTSLYGDKTSTIGDEDEAGENENGNESGEGGNEDEDDKGDEAEEENEEDNDGVEDDEENDVMEDSETDQQEDGADVSPIGNGTGTASQNTLTGTRDNVATEFSRYPTISLGHQSSFVTPGFKSTSDAVLITTTLRVEPSNHILVGFSSVTNQQLVTHPSKDATSTYIEPRETSEQSDTTTVSDEISPTSISSLKHILISTSTQTAIKLSAHTGGLTTTNLLTDNSPSTPDTGMVFFFNFSLHFLVCVFLA